MGEGASFLRGEQQVKDRGNVSAVRAVFEDAGGDQTVLIPTERLHRVDIAVQILVDLRVWISWVADVIKKLVCQVTVLVLSKRPKLPKRGKDIRNFFRTFFFTDSGSGDLLIDIVIITK